MDRILTMRLLCRLSPAHNAVTKQQFHSSVKVLGSIESSSSSDSSGSDTEKSKKVGKTIEKQRDDAAKQQTVDLLNALLAKMSGEKMVNKTIIDLAKPLKPELPKQEKENTLEEKLKVAAKEVAQTLGGDVQKREEQLLDKIFSAGAPAPRPVLSVKKSKKKKQKKEAVAVEVASLSKEEATAKQEGASLPEKTTPAKNTEVPEKKAKVPEPSLRELLAAMKIDRTPKKNLEEDLPFARIEKIRELTQNFQSRNPAQNVERFTERAEIPGNLFGGKSFGIFVGARPPVDPITTELHTWKALEDQEKKQSITHPPENYFQEMIQWTERGILWKFPIDNEQGMEAEHDVHFSEHVFVERYMEDWCPRKGPIRLFMELVCTGLSKNPYMTVEEKKGHIMWYRDYFGDKQQLLKEIGAIDNDILPAAEVQKQILT
ncbi:28S ribosomal protein S31, mitochondrial [Fopius arisanus]|uniref:Small ribosomal subunit protein mS31 n=1 Tax=Fopius arisanus TaxID=64838 RepID=A0A0C9QJX3_9HYME|nr:PREDICTED: 28S ribosomal protein S31, mitochondrial [Fopius arisanus]